MDPVSATLMIGMAAAGATTSAIGAREQNKAIAQSMQSSRKAAMVQQRQVSDQANVERQKRVNEANQVRGRLRVAAAEAGVGFGVSFSALSRQVDYDAAADLNIIERNKAAQIARVRSGYGAQSAQLQGQAASPAMAGIQGGLSGASTGLSIGGALKPTPNTGTNTLLKPAQHQTSVGSITTAGF